MEPGDVLDRYRIERKLGDGGMSRIYLAKHTVLGSLHVLKVMNPELVSSPELRERFLVEGRIQAQLRHPNIVAVTDVVALSNAAGLVMDYVEGPTLEETIQRSHGPLPSDQILAIMLPVLDGIGTAHAHGVIHRDLKPGNILLVSSSQNELRPMILDFGIARIEDDADLEHQTKRKTVTGTMIGTPAFMSPEQIRGRPLDQRTDVFSLGAILYEMATGETAFAGDTRFDTMNQVVNGQYKFPARSSTALDPAIQACIVKALKVDPNDRFQDCESFANTLRVSGQGPQASFRRPPPPDPAPEVASPPTSPPLSRDTAPAAAPLPSRTPAPDPAPEPATAPTPTPVPVFPDEPEAPQKPSGNRTGLLACGCLAILLCGIAGIILAFTLQAKNKTIEDEWMATEEAASADEAASDEKAASAEKAAIAAAEGTSDRSMAALQVFKTEQEVASGRTVNAYLDDAVRLAAEAAAAYDTPRTRGTDALMRVYAARLNWGGEHICDKSAEELVRLSGVTRSVVDAEEISAEGHLARALWAFKNCQCASDPDASKVVGTCEEAPVRFDAAQGAIASGSERDWFRFEVAWQQQMHYLITGHIYRRSGDSSTAARYFEKGLGQCVAAEKHAYAAPVNDAELYKNCGRTAAALDRWEELAFYSLKLAEIPAEGDERASEGTLSSMSRMAAFRDESCQEIPVYQDTRYRRRASWLQGYPQARPSNPIDHFCIGWSYVQLGCVTAAGMELDSYLESADRTHREEAEELRSNLSGSSDNCRVEGL